jgi:hypothetical protein
MHTVGVDGRVRIFFLALFCLAAGPLRDVRTPEPVVNTASAPKRTVLATIDDPKISELTWSLTGEVRTTDVEGRGYLELLSTLGTLPAYFSRTQAERGPMQFLGGNSQWRRFVLPFFSQPGAPAPSRLELAVFLPGRGKVELRNVTLREHAPGEDPLDVLAGWWGPRAAGWGGALGGTAIGVLGAAIGLLASRRRQRRLVMGLTGGSLIVGGACLFVGFGALLTGQPWHVHWPLLLAGAVLILVFGGNFGRVRRRYDARV